jgi:pimeloyl-ACP methyl ester carboxylesterase
MVFISGLLPSPGLSLRDQQAAEPEMMFPYRGGVAGLRERFYHRCEPEDADRAMTLLRRQALKPFVETTPLAAWPELPSSYVLGTEDRACNPDWSRRAARERLGVEPIELEGSDHSPFLSRPDELARLLVELAEAA